MYTKLTARLATVVLLTLGATACSAVAAQAYEGPTWSVGELEVKESTTVHSKSSGLTFEDAKTAIGAVSIECKATTEGKVGAEGKDEVTAASITECKNVKGCSGTITVKAVHLPWHTQLNEAEENVRDTISSSGAGQPGFSAECTVLGLKFTDECTGEISTGIEDLSGGVDLILESKSGSLNCSIGGSGAGKMAGTNLEESTSGKTLAVDGDDEEDCGIISCETNDITVNFHNIKFEKVISGTSKVQFTNHNWFRKWRPLGHTVIPIAKSPGVWTFNDGCEGNNIAPRGGTCEVEIMFTSLNETGTFIAELAMAGAPASANVVLEGSRY